MPNHALSENEVLHIYKASAGSGKTHRLTGEYLRLLYRGENNYRHILAVTFTNKATDEMKSRIVKELHFLATNHKSEYLDDLMKEFEMDETFVRRKAKNLLETILHDYSAFSVSTIDRFFQQTVRAFTREIGLAGNYNIELDQTAMLNEAIDLLISELDKPENKVVADWLLSMMKSQIGDNKSWNIRQRLQDFGKQMFKENVKTLTKDEFSTIQDKEKLESYRKKLEQIKSEYANSAKAIGKEALAIMQRHGIAYDDMSYGKNSGFLIFSKLAKGELSKPSSRLVKAANDVNNWTKDDKPKSSQIRAAYADGLNDCVNRIVALSKDDLFYNTANSILENFYALGILSDIDKRLRSLQQETDTLFLSDTTELLNHLISESDSPFIYEKTGTRLLHFMIDEFQDTSPLQWNNFLPLIRESLASNHFNLIVGDVKQSIYRFRNGDWRLLEDQIDQDFQPSQINHHALDINWRSEQCIVEFNNSLFARVPRLLQDVYNTSLEIDDGSQFSKYAQSKIIDIYAQAYQNIPKKRKTFQGYVKITFLPTAKKKNIDSEDDNDWRTESLKRLPLEIESLQDRGFSLSQIAILVRRNKDAVLVADSLLKYKRDHADSKYRYDIISNEALLVANAQSVKAAITILRHFQNPADETRRFMALYELVRFHRAMAPGEALAFCNNPANVEVLAKMEARLTHISQLPLYESVEAFFAMSSEAMNENENAFVQAFLDVVLKFSADASSDLNSFLEWWDEESRSLTLFSPEGQDAIRLITIHKSKGLEFDVVLMPFVDWEVDHSSGHAEFVWCKPDREPFNELAIVPVKYKKDMANTIFREDYLREKLLSYIDNLNLLYVALTRPKQQLICYAPKGKDNITRISDLIYRAVSKPPALSDSIKSDIDLKNYYFENENESVFEYGIPSKIESYNKPNSIDTCKMEEWRSIPFEGRLKLRLNSIGYFNDDGSRARGMLMHEIVSSIKTVNDLSGALQRRVMEGELTETEQKEVFEEITEMLSLPEVSDWYSGKYIVLNEMQTLDPEWGFSRPDRIMMDGNKAIVVDYKFGEAEDPKYRRQVQHYVKLLQKMEFSDVKGYIYYVKLRKIEQV
ncbi:MAG: ATP-dependent helicase/nuclease subunit [Bacteroidota bacterium]|jgi:ATP-dependent exoDNAse (exonuclease V) beta subunit|nr:ATP-dependent helicase/nuclease subunit [Bacteroidota bacterium]